MGSTAGLCCPINLFVFALLCIGGSPILEVDFLRAAAVDNLRTVQVDERQELKADKRRPAIGGLGRLLARNLKQVQAAARAAVHQHGVSVPNQRETAAVLRNILQFVDCADHNISPFICESWPLDENNKNTFGHFQAVLEDVKKLVFAACRHM